ncbi:MAG: gliding motility-associated C-terminal domain-containing protein [Bacteroidetes bacterium]|nr:gliding motility-associated C-terminal domain-containing protein [Bacteroidota bacterium]
MVDTTMTPVAPVNVLGATDSYRDMALLTTDPDGGFYYMASAVNSLGGFDNIMSKCPIPNLIPVSFAVPDGHTFKEVASVSYYPSTSNGFNGMACSNKYVYTYDGNLLKKWNKYTGVFVSQVNTGGIMFATGGLSVDGCDNVYAGAGTVIKKYDSLLNLTSTYNIPNVCYDLKLAPGNKLYASGKAFVSQIFVPDSNHTVITATPATDCSTCNGTAVVANSCGAASDYKYLWSDPGGQTTQSATGLCAGNYTVTYTTNCHYSNTASITVGGGSSVSINVTDALCAQPGAAVVTATGGTGILTYTWSNGQSAQTATSLTGGVYTVTVTDNNGYCALSTVAIKQQTLISAALSITNGSCYGSGDGSIAVTSTGGTNPLSYNWSNGQSAATASGLAAGSYTLTITDSGGCSYATQASVTEPPALYIQAQPVSTTPVCYNASTGGATVVNVMYGISPYTYSWNDGRTDVTITGLSAAVYTVTVTGANGCSTSQTVEVKQRPSLFSTHYSSPETCGSSNGTASISFSSSFSANYSWSPTGGSGTAGGSVSAYGLSAGTYTVTVRNISTGCIQSDTVTVQATGIISIAMSQNNAACPGSGDATANPSGGNGSAFTYSWMPSGQTTQTATGLLSGAYTVTVMDSGGCTETESVNITNSGGLVSGTAVINDVICYEENNGTARVIGSGGVAPYTYSWDTGWSNDTIGGLTAGTYTVTITDQNGCVYINQVIITEPHLDFITGSTMPVCNGDSTGSLTVNSVSSGTVPYTYQWSDGQSSANATGLAASTYSVTVTDAKGCTSTKSVTLFDPPTLISSANQFPATCGNNDGAAIAYMNSSSLTYSWSSGVWGSGGSSAYAYGLSAGTYTVTINDSFGCVETTSVIVTDTGAPTLVMAVDTTCTGLGQATVTAAGGNGPYTYSWDPGGQTTAIVTGLSAGNYAVTVTDNSGCKNISTVVVAPAPVLSQGTMTATNPLCFGSVTGSAVVSNVGGGVTPYTYSWNNGGTTQAITGLSPATYTLTVTDKNNCTVVQATSVTEPPDITVGTSFADPVCGVPNGSAAVTAAGGTGNLTYSWSGSGGATGQAINGLSAGSYTVTVTDASGCAKTSVVSVVDHPAPLISNMAGTNLVCNNDNSGSATVAASGANGTLTYSWSNGVSGATVITGLPAGNYTVTVTDALGCSIVSIVGLTEPTILSNPTFMSTDDPCGQNIGSSIASASGGTGALTYSWSTGAAGVTAANLSAAIYTLTVTDQNGCAQTGIVSISTIAGPVVAVVTNGAISCNGQTGTVIANVSGGVAPYLYSWSSGLTGATSSGAILSGSVTAGTYTITVTDVNNCLSSGSLTLTEPSSLSLSVVTTNASCGISNGSAAASVNGGTGLYTYSWSSGSAGMTSSNLSAGIYTLTLSDGNGCTRTQSVSVSNTSAPVINSISPGNILCKGSVTGSIVVNAMGTSALTYSWNTGDTSISISGQPAGNYTVTVTDAIGCVVISTASITEPATSVSVNTIAVVNTSCGQANGGLAASASGGSGSLSYSWSIGISGATVVNLTAGNYTLTVTDSNGCSAITSSAILPSPALSFNVNVTNTTCGGKSDGGAKAIPFNGTPLYTYSWSNGATIDSVANLAEGNYTVTVTDAVGCQLTTVIIIVAANPNPLADFTFTPNNPVYKGTQINFIDQSTSGSVLLWDFGNGNTSVVPNPIQTYNDALQYCITLIATSAFGCMDTATQCLTVVEKDTLVIPNVFSPNADGINDLFVVLTSGMKEFHFEIYDRWGLKMYDGNLPKIEWDGISRNGKEAPDGTYYFIYNGQSNKGKLYDGAGFLQLLRGGK